MMIKSLTYLLFFISYRIESIGWASRNPYLRLRIYFQTGIKFCIMSINQHCWVSISIIIYDIYVVISSSRKEYLEAEVTPWNLDVKGYGQNGCGNSACNCFIASGSDGPGIRLTQCQTTSNTKDQENMNKESQKYYCIYRQIP